MSALNLTFHEFETQRKIVPLRPSWWDYEERKKELQQMNFSPTQYELKIKEIASELNL